MEVTILARACVTHRCCDSAGAASKWETGVSPLLAARARNDVGRICDSHCSHWCFIASMEVTRLVRTCITHRCRGSAGAAFKWETGVSHSLAARVHDDVGRVCGSHCNRWCFFVLTNFSCRHCWHRSFYRWFLRCDSPNPRGTVRQGPLARSRERRARARGRNGQRWGGMTFPVLLESNSRLHGCG